MQGDHADRIKVKSLYKALLILEEFMETDTFLGVNQIAESLMLPKSTVSNVLSVYESRGFVERDAHSGKFKLGLKALELSNHTYQTMSAASFSHICRNWAGIPWKTSCSLHTMTAR